MTTYENAPGSVELHEGAKVAGLAEWQYSTNHELPADCKNAAHWWYAFGYQVAPMNPATKHTRLEWTPWLDSLQREGHAAIDRTFRENDQVCAVVDAGFFILDADTPEAVAALRIIEHQFDLQPNLVVRTRKGEHHHFRKGPCTYAHPDGFNSETHPANIDIRTGRSATEGRSIIVLPPSSGKVVEINEADTVVDLVEVGQDFIDAIFRHNGKAPPRPAPPKVVQEMKRSVNLSEAAEILSHVPADLGYSDWLTVLFGIHHKYQGSDTGLEIADRWSATGSNYCGREELEYKWRTMNSHGGITWSSVCQLAEKHGADLSAIARKYNYCAEPQWPELADPFTEYPVPAFPLDILPEAFQRFCIEKSAQSGFDPGGYASALLVSAGNTADHRHRLNLGPFRVPAYIWAGLVGGSGSGKSPVINAATRAAETINNALVKASQESLAQWQRDCDAAKADKVPPPPRLPWRQRHALDTTTEALGHLLVDNPEGVNLYHHEITEFIGRMDAYSGKDGGKDRGVFLRAYDGGQVTINRASRPGAPLVVPDFSVGILAGIQPDVLAQKFRQSGGGADGLYQRFAMYCLRPAGEVNYMARMDDFTETNVQAVFDQIHEWSEGKPFEVNLAPDAQKAMQDYHNHVRKLAQRTSSPRFAEHLDKFPGMLGRFAFALHLSHAAASGGDPLRMVSLDTLLLAQRLLGVLYRHSEGVYTIIDREAGKVRDLVRSAAEAILTKSWDTFKRGDLTRNATHWQGADNRDAEGAIDYLIELGWIVDVTPPTVPGRRGRRSAGLFLVNPEVHTRFEDHATRIRAARAERYAAMQRVTGN